MLIRYQSRSLESVGKKRILSKFQKLSVSISCLWIKTSISQVALVKDRSASVANQMLTVFCIAKCAQFVPAI